MSNFDKSKDVNNTCINDTDGANTMNTCTWNIGNSITDAAKSQLISMLSKYRSDVFTSLGCGVEHPYELKLIDNADLSKSKHVDCDPNPRLMLKLNISFFSFFFPQLKSLHLLVRET